MANKFLLAIAGAVAIMALLVVLPRMYSPAVQNSGNSQFTLQYHRPADSSNTSIASNGPEVLTVSNDGFASISRGASITSFQLTDSEMSEVRSLVFDTGFMNIQPGASFQSESGTTPEYTIKVQSGGQSQVLSWTPTNNTASNIPSLISRMQESLDAIIAAHGYSP